MQMQFSTDMNYSKKEKAFLVALGKRVRDLRTKKGWSQEEFAHKCGLHRTYAGAIERGERNVSAINLRKVAEALGVKVGDLF